MHRILVVGERPEDVQALGSRLSSLGYEAAASSSEVTLALRAVIAFKPDVVIFNTEPGDGSKETFRLLERVSQLPIIVQGDDNSGDEMVAYLDEGAVGYVPKTATPTLLSARIAAIMRRSPQQLETGVIRAGNVTLDLERRHIHKNGSRVPLTPTEFKLLRTLAEHSGRPCVRSSSYNECGGRTSSAAPIIFGSTWAICARSSKTTRKSRGFWSRTGDTDTGWSPTTAASLLRLCSRRPERPSLDPYG